MVHLTPAIREIAEKALGNTVPISIEPVGDGISTVVYRLRRGEGVFYLRVLPDAGESFAPEAYVHTVLRRLAARVPEVIFLEDCNDLLERSVMLTTEIRGRHVGHLPSGEAASAVLREAGRELALINSVPVEGFGWIRREGGEVRRLEAELQSNREFLLANLALHLSVLTGPVLTAPEADRVRELIERHPAWIDVDQAHLANGDFDLTHIYQEDGHYTGIIDFGEIRGTGPFYDLGHFRLHDGETARYEALPDLLVGYAEACPLPPDGGAQIAFHSLLIGLRFLSRGLQGLMRHPLNAHTQAHMRAAIERDLALLRNE